MTYPLLLLHGALGAALQFEELKKLLQPAKVFSIDFYGHGEEAETTELLRIESMAKQVLGWMEENKISKVNIFGYSLGGYVALKLASEHPEQVGQVMTLATKFDWTPETAAKEGRMVDPEKIEQKVPAFAKALEERHGQKWKSLCSQTAEMMTHLGAGYKLQPHHLHTIRNKVLLSLGDCDQMVTVEETESAFQSLPNASMLILPETHHPFERVDQQQLAWEIKWWFGYA